MRALSDVGASQEFCAVSYFSFFMLFPLALVFCSSQLFSSGEMRIWFGGKSGADFCFGAKQHVPAKRCVLADFLDFNISFIECRPTSAWIIEVI